MIQDSGEILAKNGIPQYALKKKSSNWYLGSWGRQHGNSLRCHLALCLHFPNSLNKCNKSLQGRQVRFVLTGSEQRPSSSSSPRMLYGQNENSRRHHTPALQTPLVKRRKIPKVTHWGAGSPARLELELRYNTDFNGGWIQQYPVPLNALVPD